MKRKLISLVLVLAMLVSVFSVLPVMAVAETTDDGVESALTEAEREAGEITVKTGADGTASAPLEIWNAAQLSDFAAKVNSGASVGDSELLYTQASAKLMADISFNEGYTFTLNSNFLVEVKDAGGVISYLGTGKGGAVATWYKDSAGATEGVNDGFVKPTDFTPIGATKAQAYLGTFDGNNHKISGVFYASTSTAAAGLFGYAGTNAYDNVTIKNVSVVGSVFVGKGYIGGIVGGLYNNINDPTSSSNKCDHSDGVCDRGFTNDLNTTTKQTNYKDILPFRLISCNNVKSIVASVSDRVGGIVGESSQTTHYALNAEYRNSSYAESSNAILSCTNSATVIGKGEVGGIAGRGNLGCLNGSVNKGDIYGSGDYVAGIVGRINNNYLVNVTNHGNVTSTADHVAGIVGFSTRLVENGLNTGRISGNDYVAGFIAYMDQSKATYGVENCANLGAVHASGSYAAGMVAHYKSGVTVNRVVNVYNYASITAATENTTAAIAVVSSDSTAAKTLTVDNVYSVGGTAFLDLSGKSHLVTTTTNYSSEITAEQVKNGELLSLLSGFTQSPSFPYPIPSGTVVFNDLQGSGTNEDPYRIYTAADLYEFASRVNNGYVDELGNAIDSKEISAALMNNIALNEGYTFGYVHSKGLVSVTRDGLTAYVGTGINGSAIATWYSDTSLTAGVPEGFVKPTEWTPIGTSSSAYFGGSFDGNGYTVSGLFIAKDASDLGLFGYIGGVDSDDHISIDDLEVTGSAVIGNKNVGLIVGSANSNVGDLSTSTFDSNTCDHRVNTTCKRGSDVDCNITNCSTSSSVVAGKGGVVGGIIGYAGGTRHYFTADGTTTGYTNATNSYGAMQMLGNSTNDAVVASGGTHTGGIIGNAARVKYLSNLTNKGDVYSTSNRTAGIAGNNTWGSDSSYLFNSGNINGNSQTAGIFAQSQRGIAYALNTGDISGTDYVAGIISYKNSNSKYSISYTGNAGDITATGNYAAGIVAQYAASDPTPSLVSIYNAGAITAAGYSAAIVATPAGASAISLTLSGVYSTGGLAALATNDATLVSVSATSSYNNSVTKSQVSNGELAVLLGAGFGQSKNDPCPIPGSSDILKWVLAGASLDLSTDIKANLYIALGKEVKSTDIIKVTVNGRTEEYTVSSTTLLNGYRVITVDTAAKEMTDTITVEIYSDSTPVGTACTYSVKQYADTALGENSTLGEDAKALVEAMINYGGAAQRYFGHNTDNLVSEGVNEVTIPEASEIIITSGDTVCQSATLILEGDLKLRYYFVGTAEGKQFTVNGKAVSATNKGDCCYVEIPVTPTEIATAYTVTAGTTSVTYSVHNYLYNKKDSEELSELVAAIYDYYIKAVAYVAPISTLASISIEGSRIKGFTPEVVEYDVSVIEASEYPTVTAVPSVSGATVMIEQATAENGGVATITVVSPDGNTTTVYTVAMSMVESLSVSTTIEKAKGGADSIVVIVNDDTTPETADFLVEEYEKYDLIGTLAIPTNKFKTDGVKDEEKVAYWQSVLDTGRFSMSSHTRTHGYWGRTDAGDSGTYYPDADDRTVIEEYEIEPGRITSEVKGSQDDIREYFPSQRCITFIKAGMGVNTDGSQVTEEALNIIKANYITMRNTGGGVDTIPAKDPYSIKSYLVSDKDTAQTWIDQVDQAIRENGMIVFLFHGIQDKKNASIVAKNDATQLFAYVAEQKTENRVWCTTFEEASLYTEECRTATASAVRYSDRIELTLTDEWDNALYDYALTVRVEVPETWTSVTQTVGGVETVLEVMSDADGSYVYASVVPDSGVAILTSNG